MTGAAYRQIDYWDRSGLLRPSGRSAQGRGSQRLYSFQDLVKLRAVSGLRKAGVSLQRIRRSLEYLGTAHPEIEDPLRELRLHTDGRNILISSDGEPYLEDTLRHGQLVWECSLLALKEELGDKCEGEPDLSRRQGSGKRQGTAQVSFH